jgi:hypothetical protein
VVVVVEVLVVMVVVVLVVVFVVLFVVVVVSVLVVVVMVPPDRQMLIEVPLVLLPQSVNLINSIKINNWHIIRSLLLKKHPVGSTLTSLLIPRKYKFQRNGISLFASGTCKRAQNLLL